jgi:IclR family acetate operon transcriptional repressor
MTARKPSRPEKKRREAAPAGPPISSVDRALEALLLFRAHRELHVSDLCDQLGVTFSTAYRLMTALAFRGLAEQVPGGRAYRPGPALLEIGIVAMRDLEILGRMEPSMERAASALNETVLLATLAATDVLVLGAAEPDRTIRVNGGTIARIPAHTSAAGQALLAELTDDELRARYTPARRGSAVAPEQLPALEAELARVRAAGYAVAEGDADPEVSCVAVVIPAAHGAAQAALVAAGPRSRFHGKALDEAAHVLAEVLASS